VLIIIGNSSRRGLRLALGEASPAPIASTHEEGNENEPA
jgi:hypothetical protein